MSRTATVIAPGAAGLGHRLRELWLYRELLFFMVWRDAKVRYRHTVLGVGWALIQPLLTMAIFTVVFGRLAKLPSDGQPYALFTFAAIVPWSYFSAAITSGAGSLVGQEHVISKVYFPRLAIPFASILSPLVDLAVTLTLLLTILVATGRFPGAALLLLPPFIALAIVTALAVALWFSALNVTYRDVRYLLPFVVQAWTFASPVGWGATMVPERWRPLFGLNPMASVIEGFRWALLGTSPPGPMLAVSVIVVAIALVTGLSYFRRMEGTFADVL